MLNAWLNIPIEIRLSIVAVVGVLLGVFANWAIYNVCYFPRPISPWGRKRWLDEANPESIRKLARGTGARQKTPIFGWLFLSSESDLHGKLFWVRPLLLEVLFPVFLVWFYKLETEGGLLPPEAMLLKANFQDIFHLQFLFHSCLVWLMVVATFIDFDERTIPDMITVPGTLLALVGSAFFQGWHMWVDVTDNVTNAFPTHLHTHSPWDWPLTWNSGQGLLIGVLAFLLWCFALADRRVILRRGWRKAVQYFFAGLVRNPSWRILVAITIAGVISIFVAFLFLDPLRWRSLLSSLMGMALGGGLVWVVRIFARLALGVEAMGFGDVTLMAMVGAFLGWQPAWLGFFFAPFFALVFVLVAFIITGDNQAPFGPYLCAGSLFVLIYWNSIWNEWAAGLLLTMGPQIGMILLAGLFLMFGMLWVWRLMKMAMMSGVSRFK